MGRIRKVPQRICVGCQQTKSKKELIRIVRTPDLQVKIDATSKLSGRGAYLCRDPGCLVLALTGKKLQRALHVDLPPEIVESLKAQLAVESPA
ncbi:MAG: YlxR family protein [Thermacetogeniaceae bacterium]